jgi:hypothetical protein
VKSVAQLARVGVDKEDFPEMLAIEMAGSE